MTGLGHDLTDLISVRIFWRKSSRTCRL